MQDEFEDISSSNLNPKFGAFRFKHYGIGIPSNKIESMDSDRIYIKILGMPIRKDGVTGLWILDETVKPINFLYSFAGGHTVFYNTGATFNTSGVKEEWVLNSLTDDNEIFKALEYSIYQIKALICLDE
jgi:hypothetical protein